MVRKLTVEIPDDLNEQLNIIAKTKGLTKQDLVEQILRSYVEGTVITEDTLENVNARCIWEAIKILQALQKIQLDMEEKRLAMEIRLKRKYLLGELAHASNLAKALAKYAEKLKSPKDLSKEEEKRLADLLETFVYGIAARMGLLPEEWVVEEESGSTGGGGGGKSATTVKAEEEGVEEEEEGGEE